MNLAHVEQLANALLYEGYLLYPYRLSSVKNRQRWTFGVLCPRSHCTSRSGADGWIMQTECLVQGHAGTRIDVKVRFLHVLDQIVGKPKGEEGSSLVAPRDELGGSSCRTVRSLGAADQIHPPCQEAVERELSLTCILPTSDELHEQHSFSVRASRESRTVCDIEGSVTGVLVRRQNAIRGRITVSAQRCDRDTFVLRVRIENTTRLDDSIRVTPDEVILSSLVSVHTILSAGDAEWISLLEPPERLREAAASCENIRTWPVLVGDRRARNVMLSSPIILYDYPRVAPESPGDLFDATEIDEMLSLRIQTLTDDEKKEAATDPRVRYLLARTESLSRDELSRLHGVFRRDSTSPTAGGNARAESTADQGAELRPGARVRLRPRRCADAFDLLLSGKTATVRSIEKDSENNVFVTVTVDDDPGRDLGQKGKVAHRFFFRTDEIEPLGRDEVTR